MKPNQDPRSIFPGQLAPRSLGDTRAYERFSNVLFLRNWNSPDDLPVNRIPNLEFHAQVVPREIGTAVSNQWLVVS